MSFFATDPVSQPFDRDCACDSGRSRKLAFYIMVVTNQTHAFFQALKCATLQTPENDVERTKPARPSELLCAKPPGCAAPEELSCSVVGTRGALLQLSRTIVAAKTKPM